MTGSEPVTSPAVSGEKMSLPVTEDTPPDMLAGSMDLNVVLPNGKNVKMSIQRSTPMMDLLVQVTTANRLSPGNYSIQAMSDRGVLPYKPSTPIGTLDAFTIKIVDKKLNSHKKASQMPQSFLNTFRLQVNLPRSQLFVARVTPDITLGEILTHVCTEKNLDVNKYEFRIPGNPDENLELDKTLGSYKVQELSLVNKNSRAVGGLLSSADILHVKSSKHRQNSVCESSLSSGSLGSRSTSPVPVNTPRVPPQAPIRKKRRPAPKPPQINENESKEETKTSRPAMISHSRESSDSSGYHEASVLSESPTHGAPIGLSESTSPPDTLPRHGKLLPSQSFTNLATMQPPSRTRLTSSVSNASLSSNGRKKRAAPPPPLTTYTAEEKMKSSTLPTSRAEERISNVPFVAAENGVETLEVVEESNTKVESVEKSVENVSKLITETKVDVATIETETKPFVGKAKQINSHPTVYNSRVILAGGMGANQPKDLLHRQLMKEMVSKFKVAEDRVSPPRLFEREEPVDVSGKPIPKPRTFVQKGDVSGRKVSLSRSQTDSVLLSEEKDISEESKTTSTSETLKNIKSTPKMGEGDDGERSVITSTLERWRNVEALACLNDDEKKATKSAWLLGDPETSGEVSPTDEQEHDSLNWQYQLPPPPTDFRDAHSPNCTEFGTVTITPDVFRDEVVGAGKDEEFRKTKDCQKSDDPKRREVTKKPSVMSELTNVPPDSWKTKEKSSSVTNLYMNEDSVNNRRVSSLSYSRSFTNELPMKNYKMTAYESYEAENNREDSYEKEIRYKNYKNLEKSLSMECIQTRSYESENKSEEVFRRPVAPVQKKLKVAKRSASTYNNPAQRRSESDLDAETDNMEVLHQHFLDFLKEKKLSSDLNMKSLSVIRHILPKISGGGEKEKTEADSVDFIKPRVTTGPVKVVDFKRKTSSLLEREVKENVVIIEKERYDDGKELEMKSKPETDVKREVSVKKYSYHAPPSINFATWGERPKTQVLIKDEDYVTENKVTKRIEKKLSDETPKPVVMKKPNPLQFKKPGVKSNYEMFSALPKKKEVTSLTLIKMEEEEKMKRKMVMKEPSRVPIVCGVELKKEFKEQQSNKSISITEVTIKPEATNRPHSVSIYINGNQQGDGMSVKPNMATPKPLKPNYTIPRKGTSLMPVVKGFRLSEEQNNQSHVNINKICNISNSSNINNNNNNNNNDNNNINNGISANNGFTGATDRRNDSSAIYNQNTKRGSEVSLAPPPPPPFQMGLPKLKPVAARQIKPKTISDDPRGQLMEDIRNFRGFNSHKLKTAQ